jgi:hypothetical protein
MRLSSTKAAHVVLNEDRLQESGYLAFLRDVGNERILMFFAGRAASFPTSPNKKRREIWGTHR